MATKIYIVTDMEGVSGIGRESQAYAGKGHVDYEEGRRLLMADVNAAIQGAFGGGATDVTVLDGHLGGGNFVVGELDPRATLDTMRNGFQALAGLDESFAGLFVVGQHAMAGTIGAFMDHTQCPRVWCDYRINDQSCGELGQAAAYAGAFGVPLLYACGDSALCTEAQRQFPGVITTAVKEGLSWSRARCFPVAAVQAAIEDGARRAMALVGTVRPWRLTNPIEIALELAWTGAADDIAWKPGVERLDARRVRWSVDSASKVYWVP